MTPAGEMWSVVTESPSRASTRASSMSASGPGSAGSPSKNGGLRTYRGVITVTEDTDVEDVRQLPCRHRSQPPISQNESRFHSRPPRLPPGAGRGRCRDPAEHGAPPHRQRFAASAREAPHFYLTIVAAILAVGEAVRQPVVREDQVAVATTMTLILSIDHRAVDGATAAGFLTKLKELIEEPLDIVL